jgi:hypothetical protein
MDLTEFISKTIVHQIHYVIDIDSEKKIVQIFFEDGSRAEFSFDLWFCLLELSYKIVSMNVEINEKLA